MKGTLEHGKIGVMLPVNGTWFSQRAAGSPSLLVSFFPFRMHLVIALVDLRSGRKGTVPGEDDVPLVNLPNLFHDVAPCPHQGSWVRPSRNE